MIGQRFGRLVVVAMAHVDTSRRQWIVVACDCGTGKTLNASNVRRGLTKSCGCLRREATAERQRAKRDPERHTPTYSTWVKMLARCRDQKDYGGRGIAVCERWLVFENFLADMGHRPAGRTIDRINNGRGYEHGNCRWATPETQSRNRPGYVKLTPDAVRAIRESNSSPRALAMRYDVARSTIYAVRSGRIWKTSSVDHDI